MFQVGDFIIYGNTGVCCVKGTTVPDFLGVDKDQLYYVLDPLYQDGTIYAPVDCSKVFMRPIISKEEAKRLIDAIPTVKAEAYHNGSVHLLTTHYEEVLQTHDCADLIELTMSIYIKKQFVEEKKKKFGAVDKKFMKRAEDLLFEELAIALGISKEEVPEYIEKRIQEAKK